MPSLGDWKSALDAGACAGMLTRLYPKDAVSAQRRRWRALIGAFEAEYGARTNVSLFSAPGRCEIAGNHTDHQNGRVLAAAISLDAIAAASRSAGRRVCIVSDGYAPLRLDLADLSPRADERGRSHAFVRGIAARLAARGYEVGGFDAAIHSEVPRGSGLSSSAAYGVLIGTVFSGLFNGGAIPPVELALAAQYAENNYFGKPSGLMDQLASALGGFTAIDFADPQTPRFERVACDLGRLGATFVLVNAGGSHADLTGEYAAIFDEMRAVARWFGAETLRSVDRDAFFSGIGALRRAGIPDRAILRAMHFFNENARVPRVREALESGDAGGFMRLLTESGRSSYELLQNVCPANACERSLSLALALSELALGNEGAWRVHGGGFAGTILAVMPRDAYGSYRARMEEAFGAGCCYRMNVRACGGASPEPVC